MDTAIDHDQEVDISITLGLRLRRTEGALELPSMWSEGEAQSLDRTLVIP